MCAESQYSPNCGDASTMAGLPKIKIAYSPEPDDRDVRELPLYSLAEVAYFVGVPKTTMHRWARYGVTKRLEPIEPLIVPADRDHAMFSFYNLVEAHILSVTTRVHKVKVGRIRAAIQACRDLALSNPNHPLLSREFHTDGLDLFVKTIEGRRHLTINVSQHGQLGLREVLDSYLRRIDRDSAFNPTRFFPANQSGRVVSVIPTVSSGRPIIDSAGIPVAAIWNRRNAGDSVELIADDYDIPESEIEGALEYVANLAA
jgi:uncharacterized protein (DUF433 family)